MDQYTRQLSAFYSYLESEPMTSGEIVLYLAIVHMKYQCKWATTIRVSNMVLMSKTGLSKSSLNRARSSLLQKGVISFVKGKNKHQAGAYELTDLVLESRLVNQYGTVTETVLSRTKVASQYGTVTETLTGTVTDTVVEPEPEPLYISNKNNLSFKEIVDGPKKLYLDFVMLEDDEYRLLGERYTEKLRDEFIERLNNYLGTMDIIEAANKYKNHYFTIKSWIDRYLREQKQQQKDNTIPFRKSGFTGYSSQRDTDYDALEQKVMERRLSDSGTPRTVRKEN